MNIIILERMTTETLFLIPALLAKISDVECHTQCHMDTQQTRGIDPMLF